MPLSISQRKGFIFFLLILLPGGVVPDPSTLVENCRDLCNKYTKEGDLGDLIVRCKDLPDGSAREECMMDCGKCDKCQSPDGNYTSEWRTRVKCWQIKNDRDLRQECRGICWKCEGCIAPNGKYDCRAVDPEGSQAACKNLCAKYQHFSESGHKVDCKDYTIADDIAREDCLGLCKKCETCDKPNSIYDDGWYDCNNKNVPETPGGIFSQKGCEEVCTKFVPKNDRYVRCHNLVGNEATECWDKVCTKCGKCRIWGDRQYDCWELIQMTPTGCKELCDKYKKEKGSFGNSFVRCSSQEVPEACQMDCRKCGECSNNEVYTCELGSGPVWPGGSHGNPGLEKGGNGESGLSGVEILAIVVVVVCVGGGVGYGLYYCVCRKKEPQGNQFQPYYNPNAPAVTQSQGQEASSFSASGTTFSGVDGGVTQPIYQPPVNSQAQAVQLPAPPPVST